MIVILITEPEHIYVKKLIKRGEKANKDVKKALKNLRSFNTKKKGVWN